MRTIVVLYSHSTVRNDGNYVWGTHGVGRAWVSTRRISFGPAIKLANSNSFHAVCTMVFDKQHLSLFVALAFLLAYANAVPTALSNEQNVERLRGDLHQFIEMIINCLTNTKQSNHSKFDPSQIQQFKQITNALQEDVGLAIEPSSSTPAESDTEETPETRKFGAVKNQSGNEEYVEETSSEAPSANEAENSSENENSKEVTESDGVNTSTLSGDSEEHVNKEEFELQEGGHNFTPRPAHIEITESAERMSTTFANPTNQPQDGGGSDIGLRILHPESKEEGDQTSTTSAESMSTAASSAESTTGGLKEEDLTTDAQEHVSKINRISTTSKQHKQGGRKSNADDSTSSNESKDKSENNTEEIQVRNLIQDAPKFAVGSSVHPYDALHIYGIQYNGPINKIVFEGGEHHPPRPLTIKESNHLKEFIKMVLATNKLHRPMAQFPVGDEIAPRSGFNDKNAKNSPWADKPVPLELV